MQSCDSGVVNKDAMPIGYGDVPCPRAILPVKLEERADPVQPTEPRSPPPRRGGFCGSGMTMPLVQGDDSAELGVVEPMIAKTARAKDCLRIGTPSTDQSQNDLSEPPRARPECGPITSGVEGKKKHLGRQKGR